MSPRARVALGIVLLAGLAFPATGVPSPQERGPEVSGRVVRADGTGVGAVSVFYYWDDGGEVARRRDVTDRKGRFRVSLPDEARGSAAGTLEVHDASGRRSGAAVVDLVAPGATDVVIVAGPPRTVRLELRDASTAELVPHGASVSLEVLRAGHWIGRDRDAAGDGVLPALRVPGGTFRLKVGAEECAPLETGPLESGELGETLVLELERRAHLRGRVLAGGEPVAGVRVVALVPDSSRPWPYHRETDERGAFAFPIPADASVELEAEHPVLGTARSRVEHLVAGTDREGVVLRFPEPGRLAGTLLLPDGQRDEELAVFLFAEPGRFAKAPLAADGSFAFECLAPGDWYARYGPAAESPFAFAMGLALEHERPPLPVRVEAGRNRVELDFARPPPHRLIAGVVVHADLPPEIGRRARVSPWGRPPDELELVERATSIPLTAAARRRPDDLFEAELYEPGPYELTLASPELPDWTFGATLELPPGETRRVLALRTALLRFQPDERIRSASLELTWHGPDATTGRHEMYLGRETEETIVPAGELELLLDEPYAAPRSLTVSVEPGEILELRPGEWE